MTKTCKNCIYHEVRSCCGAHECKMGYYPPIRPELDATNDDVDQWLRDHAENCLDYETSSEQ